MSKMMDALEAPAMTFEIECVGPDGQVKWRETVRNLVMTAGKTDIIDKYLKGSAYTAAGWYGTSTRMRKPESLASTPGCIQPPGGCRHSERLTSTTCPGASRA